MIHVDEQDYETVRKAIREAAENLESEVAVNLHGLEFIFDINRVDEHFKTIYTGVEYMGSKESYLERIIDHIYSSFRGAFDEGGTPVETDFLKQKIKAL